MSSVAVMAIRWKFAMVKTRGISYAGFFTLALALHTGALFGFGRFLRPVPQFSVSTGESVELSLVETAAPPVAEAIAELPPVDPVPEETPPASTETLPPVAEPEPVSEPTPQTVSKPEPPKPKPQHPVSKPAPPRPRVPASSSVSARSALPASSAAGAVVKKARPDYLSNPAPPYPAPSRANREEGVVLLNVAVNAQGRAESVSLARSSGFPLLDQSALDAVRGWRFTPGRIGGLAINSSVTIPIRFRLDR